MALRARFRPRLGQLGDRQVGEYEAKRAALARCALHRDRAGHHFGEPFGDRQAQSRAAKFARALPAHLSKDAEGDFLLILRNVDAGVWSFEAEAAIDIKILPRSSLRRGIDRAR